MPQWAGKLLAYSLMVIAVVLLVLLVRFVCASLIGG